MSTNTATHLRISTKSLKSMLKSILSSIKNIRLSSMKDSISDLSAYWTYYGILLLDSDNLPKYFYHNDGCIFIFKDNGSKIGACVGSYVGKYGWEMSFLEMHHSILVRSIITDDCVPTMRKLMEMCEKNMKRMEILSKEVTWLIS